MMPMATRDTTYTMTQEDTIKAVESLIGQYSLDIDDPVAEVVKTGLNKQKFGYFNGKKVSHRDLKIVVKKIDKTGDYTKIILTTEEKHTFIVQREAKKFIEELVDIQDIAYL